MLSATSFSRPKHNLEKNVTPPTDKITFNPIHFYTTLVHHTYSIFMNSLLNHLPRNRE